MSKGRPRDETALPYIDSALKTPEQWVIWDAIDFSVGSRVARWVRRWRNDISAHLIKTRSGTYTLFMRKVDL